ncbi:DUF2000 family protein [Bradyrhizobium valentinum]|uniref:DUF2000 family protein n=1 Tax=Bradyrhizobium valentinum TaxID=1518501 RepID=UPI00070F6F4B|nr:hypothetical protein CQ10_31450 [Bradyrhizobium valentinum]
MCLASAGARLLKQRPRPTIVKTTHDAANREVVKGVIRAELNLVRITMRAERKVIDKMVGGLKFHS